MLRFMKHRNKLILIFLIIIGLFFSNYRFVNAKVLVIKDVNQEKETILPVYDGKFVLIFVHSVHHTPVYEFYNINEDNQLILYETRYYSLGVGMPTEAENGFVNKDGQFVLKMKRNFDSLHLRISPIPEHTIKIGEKVYSLLDFAEAGNLIQIKAKNRLSLLKV